jgi:hypothetical protein
MTNGTAPSAIAGDTMLEPGYGFPFRLAFPSAYYSAPSYTDLPRWWSPRRDYVLSATVDKEAMWGSVVNQVATKFAALGFTVKDSQDSTRRTASAQELMHGFDGWVPFATKCVQDYLLTDNGVFIRLRRANEKVERIRLKAVDGTEGAQFADVASASPGARITAIYHMDSLRCIRTGNLTYPVRYQALDGSYHLLRWDQVLYTADMVSPRAEMYGVGRCAAGRAYQTIAKMAAMEQMVFEFLTGSGANKLIFIQGLQEHTLRNLIAAGMEDAKAKGFVYYLGSILAGIPGDTPISIADVQLKELAQGFVPREERENAYLIYAKAVGLAPGEVQPNPAGLNSGEREQVQSDQARGYGLAAFIQWFEQTFSRRVLPQTTTLAIVDENDVKNQKLTAEVQKLRAETRKLQIESGEISPAGARQLAVDAEDLPREFLEDDATAGGQLSDDEKPLTEAQVPSQAALRLIQGLPTQAPQQAAQPAMKASDAVDDLLDEELTGALDVLRKVAGGE